MRPSNIIFIPDQYIQNKLCHINISKKYMYFIVY